MLGNDSVYLQVNKLHQIKMNKKKPLKLANGGLNLVVLAQTLSRVHGTNHCEDVTLHNSTKSHIQYFFK